MAFRIETGAEPIPGYRLISRLGGGGYGDVWKCEAPGGLYKAIKFVFGQLGASDNVIGDDADTGRAQQELKSLERIKKIRHPFILALDRYEIVEGQLMIVSELADCSLFDRYRECVQLGLRGIPRDELINYMQETAEALDYMTEKHDLLHLDIKPQNLFLLCNHIKIGDFGLVKDVEGKLASVTGGFTTTYAAPETFEGFVSRFSDQYSLAIVYQELLTGVRPYSGTNLKQLLLQHLQGLPNLNPLDAADRPIIQRALAKSPSERWPSSLDLVKALASVDPLASNRQTETKVLLPTNGETESDISLRSQQRISLTDHIKGNKVNGAEPVLHNQHSESFTKVRTAHLDALGLASVSGNSSVLRPVLLIGLGQFGRVVLQTLKQEIHDHFGTANFPLIRMLAVDTDQTPPGNNLVEQQFPEDLFAMPLSRPARYIRSRDELPPVETWIDPEVLYRMPRTLVTNGIRCLGRLAFIEHYAAFVSRLERELETLLLPEHQAEACELSGLKLRTREPLVYLVTHLGGGTGSGMFLDCAYVVQSVLNRKKFTSAEVAGIFMIPHAQETFAPDLPEANAVAALHELYHYQQAGSAFRAQYQSKQEQVVHSTPPFHYCLFFEIPPQVGKSMPGQLSPAGSLIRHMARGLFRGMATPLGQVADPSWLSQSSQAMYQSFGSRVVASPRKKVIHHAAAVLCNHVIDHWLKPVCSSQLPEVQSVVNQFIQKVQIHSAGILNYLEQAVTAELQQSPVEYARRLLAPLSVPIKERLPKLIEIEKTLKEILATLGSNKGDDSVSVSMLQPTTRVSRTLRDAADHLVNATTAQLKSTLYRLVNQANHRLGFAEEVLRTICIHFEQQSRDHDQQAKLMQEKFAQALTLLKHDLQEYERLRQTTRFLWPKLPSPGEHLSAIFHARYQAMLHDRTASIFTGMRSACNGIIQDLRQCRSRLLDVRQVRRLQNELTQDHDAVSGHGQTWLIPPGFNDLFQVVQHVIDSVAAEDLESIDQRLAEKLAGSSTPLVELTQGSGEVLLPLRQLIQDELSLYLDATLPVDDVAAHFVEHHQNLSQAVELLHTEATVPVALPQQTDAYEVAYLMLPQAPQSTVMENELRQVFPELVTLQAPTATEVVLYRSLLGFQLSELSVLNESCMKAYETAKTIEHFTPHSRQDVEQWHSPVAPSPTAFVQVKPVYASES